VKRINVSGQFMIDENKDTLEFWDELLDWLEKRGYAFFGNIEEAKEEIP